MENKPTIIEETSKELKARIGAAWFLMLLGLFISPQVVPPESGWISYFICIGAFFIYIHTKYKIWWNHK